MADPARTLLILQALQQRLRTVTVANGYRTNAGADVRLEESREGADAPRITLYAGQRVLPQDARSRGEREFTLVVEARIPASLGDAQAMAMNIDEDIEQALDAYLPQPHALQLEFQESLTLDRPDGLAEVVVQQMYNTRYRR